ncbi:DNA-directed RNA polymerase II subunit 1 [Tanacetum coccineum]|uniref:DNA-directed RNA polymerase n=1 Tax=Tanacetum coccineum TaxID=301880 RepID=A0ABQ5FST0_9ASTR
MFTLDTNDMLSNLDGSSPLVKPGRHEPVKKSQGGCGAQQPKVTIEGMKMFAEYKLQKKKNYESKQLPKLAERKHKLYAERVLSVLKRISDEDCLPLGLNPKYAPSDLMILQVLPIPPPPVRCHLYDLSSSHSAYFHSFKDIGYALSRFVDTQLVIPSPDPSSSPVLTLPDDCKTIGKNNYGGNVSNDSCLHDMDSSGGGSDDDLDLSLDLDSHGHGHHDHGHIPVDDTNEDSHGQGCGCGGGGGFESIPPMSSVMSYPYNGMEFNESFVNSRPNKNNNLGDHDPYSCR